MTPPPASAFARELRWLAVLAPAVLPALLLAYTIPVHDERYEWWQHRAASLSFVATFAAGIFLGQPSRSARWPTLLGLGVFGAILMLAISHVRASWWLPCLASGVLVGIFSRDPRSTSASSWTTAIPLVLASCLAFAALLSLRWWDALLLSSADWPVALALLPCSAIGILLLRGIAQSTAKSTRSSRLIDGLVLAGLLETIMRSQHFTSNGPLPHHWGVFIAPAAYLRQGGMLLHDVPSQYGFLNTLLLASAPTGDLFMAFFWMNVVCIAASGFILYLALRSCLDQRWWQIVGGLIAIASVSFVAGDTSTLTGPMPTPSVGGIRFLWLYVLFGLLLHWLQRGQMDSPLSKRMLIQGTLIWLLSALWSVESAVYVTAAWLPAATLLSLRRDLSSLSVSQRLLAFLVAATRTAGFAFASLLLALGVIAAGYRAAGYGWPDWGAYLEYANSFSAGFGALPIDPAGPVWLLLLVSSALIAGALHFSSDAQRGAQALAWAAWGMLWSVATYFISRSHANNISNLIPILILCLAVLLHAWRAAGRPTGPGRWLWIVVPPVFGGALWLVVTSPNALAAQLTNYRITPQVGRALTVPMPDLDALIGSTQRVHPGAYSVIGRITAETFPNEVAASHDEWLPLRSPPLLRPLPQSRIDRYFDLYPGSSAGGWIIHPAYFDLDDFGWLFGYIDARFKMDFAFTNGRWLARHYSPIAKEAPPSPQLAGR